MAPIVPRRRRNRGCEVKQEHPSQRVSVIHNPNRVGAAVYAAFVTFHRLSNRRGASRGRC
ncbi:hypothetical protein A7982_14010 [Minicystis rosea]|nr:hypothetical protein A7982_14010 [Minicystis rosea]